MPRKVLQSTANFATLLSKKKGFLIKVYALLALQLAITAGVVHALRKNPAVYEKVHKLFWLWFVLSLVVILLLAFAPLPLPLQIVLFTVFSVLLGLNMLAASKKVDPNTIRAAVFGTLGIFVAMSLLALVLAALGVNLGFLTFVLMAVLLALLVAWIVTIFVPVSGTFIRTLLYIGLALFSIFVAVDTNTMLLDPKPEVVQSAIQLYLDLVNIFQNLVGLDE